MHIARYRIRKLVYFESHASFAEALARERRLKRWPRAWMNALIGEVNPDWRDLATEASLL